MEKPRILLMEDDADFRNYSRNSLENVGFEVVEISDGANLEYFLRTEKFDVILSDSDLENVNGYVACAHALKKGLIDDSILLIGMSGNPKNQKYWRGIANIGGFYNKLLFENIDLGKTILGCLNNFKNYDCWKARMPFFSDDED